MSVFAFYLFSVIALLAAGVVVFAKNPVYAILALILVFFSVAGLFVLQGAEFFAMIVVIVYVGAVAVMFLFVVMMLDINWLVLAQPSRERRITALLFGGALLAQIATMVVTGFSFTPVEAAGEPAVANTRALGLVLYTDYFLPFQLSGIILLIAMIGAIVITQRDSAARRQDIAAQVGRSAAQAVALRSIKRADGSD